MYARVTNFREVKDIDAAVDYLMGTALSIVQSQRGYQGLTASADRAGRNLGVLSLWATEADRSASDSAVAKAREEATGRFADEVITETFEVLVNEVSQPPVVGSALVVTRIAMDPAVVADNVAFFKKEVLPLIKSGPGFRALRNMINPKTGEGIVGSIWDDEQAMRAAAESFLARRPEAASRGVSFGDTSYREIVFTDLK